jgi:hypothetical protein
MPFGAEPVVLSQQERQELQEMTQSRTLPAGDVMRSRMILLLADGVAYQKIQNLLDTTAPPSRVGNAGSSTIGVVLSRFNS